MKQAPHGFAVGVADAIAGDRRSSRPTASAEIYPQLATRFLGDLAENVPARTLMKVSILLGTVYPFAELWRSVGKQQVLNP